MDERNEMKPDETMPKKKSPLPFLIAGAAVIVLLVIVLFATHVICFHEWKEATCTEAKTCDVCGKMEGAALGHKWLDPTCTKPKTCSACSETEGEALGHTWIDATCVEAKKCEVCSETEGEALGHDIGAWEVKTPPSCAEVGKQYGICDRCKEEYTEDIPKLEHTVGEWTVSVNYKVNSDGSVTPGTEALLCSVCSAELETREYTIELTNGQKNAVISAYDDIPFWHPSYDFLLYDLLMDFGGFSYEEAKFAADHVDVDWDQQAILFAKENSQGKSRSGLSEEMRYYKFSEEQIEMALKEVGY